MSLKDFSCACEWCDRTIFNLPFLFTNPQGEYFAFCSPQCMHDMIEHELSKTKKAKELNGMKQKVTKVPYAEKPWLPETPIPRNQPVQSTS